MTPSQETRNQTRNMALLIDGDNAQASLIANILAETARYGTTTVRRVYGDWTAQQMAGWKKTLQVPALHPRQQFRNAGGKNAADSALIIDAASQDDEWACLSVVGNFVHALEPAFDPRTFGYKKLTDLIKSRADLFQVRSTKRIPEVRSVP